VSFTNNTRTRVGIAAAIIIPVVVGVSCAYAFGELWFRTSIFNAVKLGTPFWTLVFWGVIVPLLLGVFACFMGYNSPWTDPREDRYGRTRTASDEEIARYNVRLRQSKIVRRTGIALIVYAIVMMIPGNPVTPRGLMASAFRNGHDTKAALAATITVSDENHPEYLRRANSVQAERLVEELNNDPAISETSDVQYSIANGEPAWCAGAYGRSDNLGRRYTTSVVCVTDTKRVVKATWNDAVVPSLGGNFSTNLAKRIAEQRPGTSAAAEDLRFGIRDGKPFLVLPVTQVTGGMHPHTVPAGVIHVDGAGDMTYDAHATRAEYGVAVVPYAVARDLRGALNHRGGYWCSNERNLNKRRCLAENTPYESTGNISGDVNSSNFSEFVLYRADGSIGMVTPLTYFGKGRNITAYFDVNVDEVHAGKMPTATLYEGVNEVSYRTLVQTLTPAYTADLTWLTEIDANADSATASRIFEITPSKPGMMVLTIGTATNPQYFVEVQAGITGDTLEFEWCIYSDNEKQGDEPRKIECRSRADDAAAIGTLRGLNLGGNTEGGNGTDGGDNNGNTRPVGTDFDLTKLTTAEIQQLINDAAAELANR
jgi:hypothetical protein